MKDRNRLLKEALEELSANDLQKLQSILNEEKINGKTIPKSKLENMDAISIADVLISYHGSDSVKAFCDALRHIPRNDLVEKISKMADEEQNSENEIDGRPAEKQKLEDLPLYNGKFSLSDMEDYALKNRDQLIRQLQKCLEPAAFETLEKQLAGSTLKNCFSFTSQQYYKLHHCRDLNTYLNNIISGKKSQEVPKQILDLLFCPIKTKRERGSHKEMKKSLAKEEKSNVQVSPKNEFTEPNGSGENKDMVESNNSICEECEETDDVPNAMTENELNEKWKVIFRALKKKYQEEGLDLSPDSQPCIDRVTVCEHERYSCLRAQNVLRIKLSEKMEYRILRILEDKKGLTTKGNPTKSMESELQFNMAVLGVRRSELMHGGEFFSRDAASFKEYEEFFEKLVTQVVLPILALYKKAWQDIFQKAWFADNILLPGVEQQPGLPKAN